MKRSKTVLANGRSQSGLQSVWGQLVPAALLCVLFVGVGVMHVTSRIWVVRAGYSLSRLEDESRQLTREHDRLKLELATLRNPARLEKLAREKLSMGPPEPGTVFPVNALKTRRTPTSPPRVGASSMGPQDTML